MPNAPSPHRIEILAFARAQILDVTGPALVFAPANDLTPPGRPKPCEIAVASIMPYRVVAEFAGDEIEKAR